MAQALQAEQLQTAFEIFNQHSAQLEDSYRALEARVERLTSELKQAKSERLKELVRTERLSQRLALLLDALPGAIIVIDGEGIIREQNSEALKLLNEPLNGCDWASIVRREVGEGGSVDGNIQLRDGRWLSLSRRPLRDEPGEILLLADVTDSRQMSELRERSDRLKAIGEMTARFAHDVRTPLASAMLYVSRLEAADESQQRITGKIEERLHDLGRMVDDMLRFAAGGRRGDECVDTHTLFETIAATLDGQLDDDTELDLLIDGSDYMAMQAGDARFTFAANANALQGALINLVMNAAQAGGCRIQLAAWRDASEIFFTVTDDGHGIPEEAQPRLFEPFFTTRPQGTGLGLAVVRTVARAHGGDVSVAALRRGSRFTVRLPAPDIEGDGDD